MASLMSFLKKTLRRTVKAGSNVARGTTKFVRRVGKKTMNSARGGMNALGVTSRRRKSRKSGRKGRKSSRKSGRKSPRRSQSQRSQSQSQQRSRSRSQSRSQSQSQQ
jgi:hypothetical protein